ncbi:hypothetical protein BJ138DRAFT_303742 [Hygrophoropsis aurantiaca]|uniref:Uncharacterized protein n=1 Tax=Hygrophoropsis aurantiaca TaxID=72124 RepID=A0ACB8A879_9AGAM|nr:hypothetical protein BJ138DRAFT_303742 [Hygrophoropsis aurantiaca]
MHLSSIYHPPSYYERPSQPMTYTFSEWMSDSMLLMPPATADNLSPLYRISAKLNLNPLAPLSYITTIQRGGSSSGPVVGSFEYVLFKLKMYPAAVGLVLKLYRISLNQKSAIVTLGDSATRLKNVLWSVDPSWIRAKPSLQKLWRWSCGNTNLQWDCRRVLEDGSPMCVCYDGELSSDIQLASFVPPPIDASPPLPAATLTVFPDGHQRFDHILMSALILERKRTAF